MDPTTQTGSISSVELSNTTTNSSNDSKNTSITKQPPNNNNFTPTQLTKIIYCHYKSHKIAMKCIPKQKNGSKNLFENEKNILSSISHPNIVKCFGSFETMNKYFLMLDRGYCDSAIFRLKYGMSTTHVKSIIFSVLNALQFLHSINICHMDIKPENIILKKDNLMNGILIDFGDSLFVNSLNTNKLVGTPNYLSPERILRKQLSDIEMKKSDIWALGVTTYELIMGIHCFNGITCQHIYYEIIKNCDKCKSKLIASKIIKEFIDNCITIDLINRMDVEKCLNHKWFNE